MIKIIRIGALVAAFATLGLFGTAANAAGTSCPAAGTSPDTYLTLDPSVGTATCYAFENAAGDPTSGNLENWIMANYPEVGTLTAKSDAVGQTFFSGSTTGSSGSFTTAVAPQYLLFKIGGGNSNPSWFLFSITGATALTSYVWSITGTAPDGGLSHVSAFVPIPAAAWLMGSGLIALFGIGRRRRAAAVAA